MTGPSRLTIAVLREAVRKRVDATSLREIADEIGMSWSGLKSFRDGGAPQRQTLQKLVRWYNSQSTKSSSPSREDFETAIAVLVSYLRDESKPRTVRERQRQELFDRLKKNVD